MKRIVVIGAGVAGLATACRLQSKGFQVTMIEANTYPGGKLTENSSLGYRFDAGPSLFTMPQLLDDVFLQAGKDPRSYYRFQKLNTLGNYFYPDGTKLTAYSDLDRFSLEVEQMLQVDRTDVLSYLQKSAKIYDSAASIFLENSLHKTKTWFNKKVAHALPRIPQLGLFETMHQRNKRLLKDDRLVQLFDRYATYNGSDPYQAPGILTSIPHLEFNLGAFFPEGGMHVITKSLYALACDLGVIFHFDTLVEEIICSDNRTTGVKTNDIEFPADVVVSNMDVYHTYRSLLPHASKPKKILAQERSSSALIFYWGIRRSFPELDLHNIFFSSDYQQEFRHLFGTHTLFDDPTVYINITSKYNEADAPSGCENWFVMINVPANSGQDWAEITLKARQSIIQKLNKILKVDIEPLIETQDKLDPVLIEKRTSSYQGSLYGTSSNSKFAAFLRHPNFSSQYTNLFFCGGSVHPGGGIPLCLQSACITSSLVCEQFAR